MKAFMDKEFMLQSPTAQHLYHAYAEDMPICDYHCHIPPREIYENRRFDNIAQVWLGGRNPDGSYFGDHYKWRVMRSNGVPEEYITGDKPDRERFQKFAEALPMAIGNPMYHWTNLELHTFFGYDGVLNGDTAEEVWNLCNDKLQHDPKLTVRGLIEQSNVAFIGTTDDPIDSLECIRRSRKTPPSSSPWLLPSAPTRSSTSTSPALLSTWASWPLLSARRSWPASTASPAL